MCNLKIVVAVACVELSHIPNDMEMGLQIKYLYLLAVWPQILIEIHKLALSSNKKGWPLIDICIKKKGRLFSHDGAPPSLLRGTSACAFSCVSMEC